MAPRGEPLLKLRSKFLVGRAAELTVLALVLSSIAPATPALAVTFISSVEEVPTAVEDVVALSNADAAFFFNPAAAPIVPGLSTALPLAGLPALPLMAPLIVRADFHAAAAQRALAQSLAAAAVKKAAGWTTPLAVLAGSGRRALQSALKLILSGKAGLAAVQRMVYAGSGATRTGPEAAPAVFATPERTSRLLRLRQGNRSGIMMFGFPLALARPARRPFANSLRQSLAAALGPARESGRVFCDRILWVHSFWRDMPAFGIDVTVPLIKASVAGVADAVISSITPFLWGALAANLKLIASLADQKPALAAALANPTVLGSLELSGGLIALYGLQTVANYIYADRLYEISNRMMEGLVNFLTRRAWTLPMNDDSKDALVALTGHSLFQIQEGATNAVVKGLKFGLIASLSLGAMTWISWKLTLLTAPALVLGLALPSVRNGQRMNAAYADYFGERQPQLISYLIWLTRNVLEVKAADEGETVDKKVRELSWRFYREGGREIASAAVPQYVLSGGISNLALAAIAVAALLFVLFGGLSLKLATAYLFLSCTLFSPSVKTLAEVYFSLCAVSGAAEKFDRIRHASPESDLGEDPPPVEGGWEIELKGVKLRYAPDKPVILDGVNMKIPRGAFAGIVGSSGGGKTTIVKAVLRLFSLENGAIAINGRDIHQISPKRLRRKSWILLQGAAPLPGTIADNIRWRHPDVPEEDVWAAARAVGLHDDIMRWGYEHALAPPRTTPQNREELRHLKLILSALPRARAHFQGPSASARPLDESKSILANLTGGLPIPLETVIETLEREEPELHREIVRLGYTHPIAADGGKFSGGQGQRLRLAGLLAAPPNSYGLIILDEPTSALDAPLQSRFMSALLRRYRGKTTIVIITHRLQPIAGADLVFALDKGGRVAQQGAPRALMQQKGIYSQLASRQKSPPRKRRRQP